ncbi:protein-disulfide reductase [Spatholobus suberectus]|nr:protein-disulfide reductase [Spatholobus suberectus]
MEQIEHFSHIHPLLLKEERKNDNKQVLCSGCEKPISGPVFCCDQCDYVVHKTCTELPRHMKHPLHPEHPLILLSTTPYEGDYVCDACRGLFKNFVYHCYLCNYDLDVSCASRWHPDDGHRHAFIFRTNPQSFVCYACGMQADKGLVSACTICQIWVHSSCAELPLAIRIKGHDHRLNLTYALHRDYGFWGNITCGACNGAMSPAFAGYFCSTCKFPVHLKCPQQNLREERETATEDEDEESFTGYETEHSQDIDFTFSFFGHEHLLKFVEDQSTLQYFEKLCDGCAQPIMPPFFSCQEENCGFFLHQSCAELPRTKQHPFHVHPLTLLSKAPPYDGIYRCDGCRSLSNGFVYRCDECQFDLDVCCGSLQERVDHKSHMHPLSLKKTSVARQCRGCHLWSKHVLVCDVCEDFAIDCGCATLPCKAWHMYDKHPLSLNYFVERGLRKCECGICNEKMSPNQWFYYCDDCDFIAHPYCVVGKAWRIKFGSSFQYDVHSHPLALVEETEQKCEACGEHCSGWALECGQCKCYFHREEKCFWKEFKKSANYLGLSGMMKHRYAANLLASTPNVTTK